LAEILNLNSNFADSRFLHHLAQQIFDLNLNFADSSLVSYTYTFSKCVLKDYNKGNNKHKRIFFSRLLTTSTNNIVTNETKRTIQSLNPV